MTKIEELEKKADLLDKKAKEANEEYEAIIAAKKAKQNRAYAAAMAVKPNQNTKTFQSTSENKTSIGAPKISNRQTSVKLKALNASKSDYYNKNIELCGYLSISTHYWNGYNNADDTHYSFVLTDKYGYTAQVYFKKDISKPLFEKLINIDDLLVNIEVIPDKNKNKDNHDDILLEGIKYEILSL